MMTLQGFNASSKMIEVVRVAIEQSGQPVIALYPVQGIIEEKSHG